MSKKHRYTNPAFAKPLTKEEASGVVTSTVKIPKNELGKPITCSKCGQPGGTLCKTPGTKTNYTHSTCMSAPAEEAKVA